MSDASERRAQRESLDINTHQESMNMNAKNAARKMMSKKIAAVAAKSTKQGAPKQESTAPVAQKGAPVKKEAPKQEKSKAQFVLKGAGADALQGRLESRTHAIHKVLLDAALTGALITTKEITSRATAFMQQSDKNASCNATGAHINTMKTREYIVREGGAWRLTDVALELCGAKWAQDVSVAKKKK